MSMMKEILIDTGMDSVKMLPYLFAAFVDRSPGTIFGYICR